MRKTLVIRLRILLALCLLAPGLGACGHTDTSRIMTGRAGHPHNGPVRIIMQGSPTPNNYVEVAVVQAIGVGLHGDLEHTIQGLIREAQLLGCHAVINIKVDQGRRTASASGLCVRRRVSAQAAN